MPDRDDPAARSIPAPTGAATGQDATAGRRGFDRRRAGGIEGARHSAPMRARASDGLAWSEATPRARLTDRRAAVPECSVTRAWLRNRRPLNGPAAYRRQPTGEP